MRLANIAMWATFALILFICGVLLLFACDLNWPYFPDFGRKYCPATVNTDALDQEIAKGQQLRGQIHDAEVQVARIPECAAPAPSRNPPPAATRPPAGPVVGARGKLEITLWWNTTADLDLDVDCPGGKISPLAAASLGPGICGDGTHDVDANRNMVNPVNDPKEHVTWNKDVPSGKYTVWAHPRRTANGTPIQYSVRVQLDDEVKVCSGTVYWDAVAGTGFRQSPIQFEPSHPLPDCNLVNDTLSRCTVPACQKN
jgi:hypothetical protein